MHTYLSRADDMSCTYYYSLQSASSCLKCTLTTWHAVVYFLFKAQLKQASRFQEVLTNFISLIVFPKSTWCPAYVLTHFLCCSSHLTFSLCRSAELLSPYASRSSCPERHPHGSQCGRHDPLHAGSQLYHWPDLPGLSLCSLCSHGKQFTQSS